MAQPLEMSSQNEATYESLISLIENNQGLLSLILVACDDLRLRQRVIEQYETEARGAKIRPYRIVLGTEPSLRGELAKLGLRAEDATVVTVTGAEWLLRIKMRESEEQSDLDKFFGYLQWTREGLREFRHPIVLWVTHRILREMSRRAPDFWSWRKAVLRFASEEGEQHGVRDRGVRSPQAQLNDEFLPPLEELLLEIQQLESTTPESANLATLYDKLGQVHANRIANGKATNLEQERQQTIDAFQNSIHRHQKANNQSDLVNVLMRFGSFLDNQSCYEEAIAVYQQSLEIAREIGDRKSEASSLGNLGFACNLLGQYQRAIDFYQQSLEIRRKTGDLGGEAISLIGLGNAYYWLGQYQRAIDFYQQSLEIAREVDSRRDEAHSLGNLGSAYKFLGQYERAIELHQQSLEIAREIGDLKGEASSLGSLGAAYHCLGQYERAIKFHQQWLEITCGIGDQHGEANSLFNKALSLAKYESRRFEAVAALKQARAIYVELKLDHMVEECDSEIYAFERIIATQELQRAPKLDDATPRRKARRKINWVLWFCVGVAIVLLIAWLRK
jgi:tetratricopeptide (TPR) repeat protein